MFEFRDSNSSLSIFDNLGENCESYIVAEIYEARYWTVANIHVSGVTNSQDIQVGARGLNFLLPLHYCKEHDENSVTN